MSKDRKTLELENRLIDFAVWIIRIAEALARLEFEMIFVHLFVASLKQSAPKTSRAAIFQPRSALLHDSKFLV
jgi:hypothetical protein